jgi:hypothetical protein
MHPPTEAPYDAKLHALEAVIAVYTRLMRIRIATQQGPQRLMTLSSLEHELDVELGGHPTQQLVDNVLSSDGIRFRDAYTAISTDLMSKVGEGVTAAERVRLGL